MPSLDRIASFSVDHDLITEGIYVSRIDGDVTTYDMRTRVPNGGDYMDNLTMHSVEHLFATYVRGSEIGGRVVYFGPMGCQTGFYLLVRDADNGEVLSVVKSVLEKIILHEGEMPGGKREECGNYLNLDLSAAKRECERYLSCLEGKEQSFEYPKK
jgi:S-ribosylhomocysteine lyase